MTLLYWPSDLPQHMLRDGWRYRFAERRLHSKTDSGPGKVRPRASRQAENLACQLTLDWAQSARFSEFFNDTTKGGSTPFVIRDQRVDGGVISTDDGLLLTTDDGLLLTIEAKWLVRVAEQTPEETPEGGYYWRYSFSIIVLPV